MDKSKAFNPTATVSSRRAVFLNPVNTPHLPHKNFILNNTATTSSPPTSATPAKLPSVFPKPKQIPPHAPPFPSNLLTPSVFGTNVPRAPQKSSALPPPPRMDILSAVKRRFDSLKQLQMKSASYEAEFYEEMYLLECKYNKLCKPLNEKRRRIITGEHEPTDDECQLPKNQIGSCGDSCDQNDLQLCKDLVKNTLVTANSKSTEGIPVDHFFPGLPDFWLTVLKRSALVSQMIEPHDEPVLRHLRDIEIDLTDRKPYSYVLKFHFAPNDYFSNHVLTKTYEFRIEMDASEPYVYEAPETECSRGSKIAWKRGKNVTVMADVDGGSAAAKQASFFNFFDTLEFEAKDRGELTRDEEMELSVDYEIGFTFKEKVVPRAILYYTGEIQDDDDDDDSDEDDEEEDEGDNRRGRNDEASMDNSDSDIDFGQNGKKH